VPQGKNRAELSRTNKKQLHGGQGKGVGKLHDCGIRKGKERPEKGDSGGRCFSSVTGENQLIDVGPFERGGEAT